MNYEYKYHPDILLRKNIGKFIKKSRLNISLTGGELGQILNVSQQQISRYENGVTGITVDKLARILDVLNSSWPELYSEVFMMMEDKYK